MATPFHDGELSIQRQAGVQHMASRVGRGIRDSLPPDLTEFLREQFLAGVASIDNDGHVWASVLIGAPGFLNPLDSQTVQIDAKPLNGDPLAHNLSDGKPLGLLAINFAERQRMRLNGKVQYSAAGVLQLTLEQVFGNCPKYIQSRQPDAILNAANASVAAQRRSLLSAGQQQRIGQADTFFIASAHPESGVDSSHRGGNPGFIHILSDRLLEFPDYSGNMMFNTLGNLALNPDAGLVFIDFEHGGTLQLSGHAVIHWDKAHKAAFPGAERVIAYQVREVVEIAQAIPMHFQLLERSRHNPT